MTEPEWLACAAPLKLLRWLKSAGPGRDAGYAIGSAQVFFVERHPLATDRKLRLLACAAGRHVSSLWISPRMKDDANYHSSMAALVAGERWAESGQCPEGFRPLPENELGHPCLVQRATAAAELALSLNLADLGSAPSGQRFWAELLRHVIGNPFHAYPATPSWPTSIVRLAEAVYNGADATFAMHDALLEAGYPDRAEHFQTELRHPKGCWVIDLILGKE